MATKTKEMVSVLITAFQNFSQKSSWVLASHIAMSMMLALFPFVLFTVALGGAVADMFTDQLDMGELIDLIFASWPQNVADPIKGEAFAVLQQSGGGLITLGALLALYFASNGVDAVRVAIVAAYGQEDTRPFWQRKLICLGLVVLGGVGLLTVAVFELVLPLGALFVARYLPESLALTGWQSGMNGILVASVPMAAVVLYHVVLPVHRLRLQDIWPGILITLFGWWGLAFGFALYISQFASYSATYAGLAGAMAALVFLYLNAALLIFGAEVNGALIKRRKAP